MLQAHVANLRTCDQAIAKCRGQAHDQQMATASGEPEDSQLPPCAVCSMPIDSESPAIAENWAGGDFEWTYHPFVGELRPRVDRLYHPVCHANTYGVDRLVDVIHARDVSERRELSEMAERLEFLKQQLIDTTSPQRPPPQS